MASDTPNGNIHSDLSNLADIELKRVLNEDTDKKIIFIEAEVKNSKDPAVLVIEKLPWKPEDIEGLLCKETKAVQQFNNDIYGQYSIQPPAEHNPVKLNLVHPATQKHIDKYLSSPGHLVRETPRLYLSVTLPHLQEQQFSLQWVYNVLEHKKEADRIIFEDPNPETGFILAPDFKWSGESVSDLYCLAIVHKRGIKSLRDLTASHLPLLRNIASSCAEALRAKHGLAGDELRLYLHYQPSYYHLHVHVTSVNFTPPGSGCDKGHLLDSVISNIEMDPCYYQKATLSFVVREKDKLFSKYKAAGYFDKSNDVEDAGWFGSEFEAGGQPSSRTREFLEMLGQAKHEPCGEFWETTYGEVSMKTLRRNQVFMFSPDHFQSAWRMCVMALCLCSGDSLDTSRMVGLCLASSLTSLGDTNDENTEWAAKITDVSAVLARLLPPHSAASLATLFEQHSLVRRGKLDGSKEHRAYRGVLEMEEMLLRWEEEVKEGKPANDVKDLLTKMVQVKLPGWEQFVYLSNTTQLTRTLQFLLTVSKLQKLRRTGWVRCGVREPETVAGHMFRMGFMGYLVGGVEAAVICLCHDIAECIIGDITPHDNVSEQDKATREDKAFQDLVKDMPGHVIQNIYHSFRRYEDQKAGDEAARLVKDLDKFDMILQAWEYEKRDKKGRYLQQFFDSTATVFKTVPITKWQKELLVVRENHFAES